MSLQIDPSPVPSGSSSVSFRRGSKEGKRPDDFEDEFQKKKGMKHRPGSASGLLASSHGDIMSQEFESHPELPGSLNSGLSRTAERMKSSLPALNELNSPETVHFRRRPPTEPLRIDVDAPRGVQSAYYTRMPENYAIEEDGPFRGPLPPPPHPYGAVRRGKRDRPTMPDQEFYEPPPGAYRGSEFIPDEEYMTRHSYHPNPELLSKSLPLSHRGGMEQGKREHSADRIINGEFGFLHSTGKESSVPRRSSGYMEFSTEGYSIQNRYLPIGKPDPYSRIRTLCLLFCCLTSSFLFTLAYVGSLPFVVETEHQSVERDASSNGVALVFERLLVPLVIVLLAPVTCYTIPRHPRQMFWGGALLSGLAFLCFGMIFLGSTIEESIGWAILLRILQGIGGVAMLACSSTLVAFLYGHHLFTATLWHTATILFAFVLGPAIRQLCMTSNEGLFYWIIVNVPQRSELQYTLALLLKLSKFWFLILCCVVLGMTVGSYYGSLWTRLHDATQTGAKVGLLFGFFLIFNLIALYVTTMVLRMKHEFMIVPILIGATSNFVGIFVFGEFTGLRPELWSYGFLEIFLGIGCSTLGAPLYFQLLEISRMERIPESLRSCAVLSSIFTCSLWMGLLFGLAICLYGFHSMGFLASKLILAFVNLAVLILLISYILYRRKITGAFEWTFAPNSVLREEFIVTQEFYDESQSITPTSYTAPKSYQAL